MTIKVDENEDGTLTISWDPNDPVECVMNTWTEEKFIEELKSSAEKILKESGSQSVT
jgi:hypothetical protein